MTTATGQRLDIAKLAPEVYKAMIALDAAARKGLEPTLVELVLTRASQLNHCAWCLDMHTRDARKVGVTEQKLYLLNAWEEARGMYSDRERAALALTEAVTVLTDGFVPDESVQRGCRRILGRGTGSAHQRHFDDQCVESHCGYHEEGASGPRLIRGSCSVLTGGQIFAVGDLGNRHKEDQKIGSGCEQNQQILSM